MKYLTLLTERHCPPAVRMQGRSTSCHACWEVSLATAAHRRKSRERGPSASTDVVVHQVSKPSDHLSAKSLGHIWPRRPVFISRSCPAEPSTWSISTGPFRSTAGLRSGHLLNASASSAGGTTASAGLANVKPLSLSAQTGTTAASSSRVRNLASQWSLASNASRPRALPDGEASTAKAAFASAGSENERAVQRMKLASTSAIRSAISRCQALSSMSLSQPREIFSSQSALMWRRRGRETSVGKGA